MKRELTVFALLAGLILVIALSGCASPEAGNNTTANQTTNVSVEPCNLTVEEQQCAIPPKNETQEPQPVNETEEPPISGETPVNTTEIASSIASQTLSDMDEVNIGDMY